MQHLGQLDAETPRVLHSGIEASDAEDRHEVRRITGKENPPVTEAAQRTAVEG